MITRLLFWRDYLNAEIIRSIPRKYEWGIWDCVHFATRLIQVQTVESYDLSRDCVQYRTKEEAERILAACPMPKLFDEACARAGMVKGPGRGEFGALGLAQFKGLYAPLAHAVGIYDSNGVLLVMTEQGLDRFAPRHCTHSWRIA